MYKIKEKYNKITGEQQLNPKDNTILFHLFRNEEKFGGWVVGIKPV
jgi:hypothetical protein